MTRTTRTSRTSRETIVYESCSLWELHTLEGLRRIYKSTTRTTRTTRPSRETMVYESYSLCELRIIRGNTESFARMKNMTETYGLLLRKHPQFRSRPTRKGICLFGTKSALTGTHEGSRKLPILDFIQITSIDIHSFF